VWGYRRVHGELAQLGCQTSEATVRRDPARMAGATGPLRAGWIRPGGDPCAQAEGLLPCDFSPVDAGFPQRLYVLFVLEVTARRVHIVGQHGTPAGVNHAAGRGSAAGHR
jgi:putative transposase